MRVLQIVKYNLEKNGISTFVKNIVDFSKSQDMKVDVFVPGHVENSFLLKELQINGSKVIVKKLKKNSMFRINIGVSLFYFLKNNKYDIIHINTGDPGLQASMVMAGKFAGVKTIVVHSHGCVEAYNILKRMYFNLSKLIVKMFSNLFITCSAEAQKFAFSNDIKDVMLLQNGVDPSKYYKDKTVAYKMRKKLNLSDDSIVIGHVGSFLKIKNHAFLIETLEVIKNKEPNVKLLLLGDGPERNFIEQKVEEKELERNVIFLGNVDNVADYMQVMDVFVFPSIKEGTPFACLEAQAVGIPCVISTGVSQEAVIDKNNTTLLDLEEAKTIWADKILCAARLKDKPSANLTNTAYDIRKSMLDLKNAYEQCLKKRK